MKKKEKITKLLQDFYDEILEFDHLPADMELNNLINKYRDLIINLK